MATVVIAVSASVALGLIMPPAGRARRYARRGGLILLLLAAGGLAVMAGLAVLGESDAALVVLVPAVLCLGAAGWLWRARNPPGETESEEDDEEGGGGGGGGGSKHPPRPRPQSPVDWDWDAFDRERQGWGDRGGDRPPQRV